MTLLVLLVSVCCTLPSTLVGPDHCSSGGAIMNDLDSARVVYRVQYGTQDQIAWAGQVHGLEGAAVCHDVLTDQVATVWYQTKRLRSPWSCPGEYIGINLTLDVPGLPAGPGELKFYDIAGRRISRPTSPGVYFVRRDETLLPRLVILR
ncbi:MAG TPA: hypothetical protein VIV56_07175 [Gemmatimonadales bacterium]